MPNGKPGDHPITDICVHRIPYFNDEVDELIRQIVDRGGKSRIHGYVLKHDTLFGEPTDAGEMEQHLKQILAELES